MTARSDDEDDSSDAVRKTCTLSGITYKRLEQLAVTGLWGTRPTQVMTALIEAGIRNAIKDGLLKDAE